MTSHTLNTIPENRFLPKWVSEDLCGVSGEGVQVAVIDSGWDYTYFYVEGVQPGKDLLREHGDPGTPGSELPQDWNGHGTACTGLILNIAADVSIHPVRVFNKHLETSVPLIVEAIEWAIEHNMQVINLSLGTLEKKALEPLYIACEKAKNAGIIIVAASHNKKGWSYPAVFDNTIGVTTGAFSNPYHYLYRDKHALECVAGGERIVYWLGGKSILVPNSTSFATPHITGIVALLLERYPGYSFEQIKELLQKYAQGD